MRLPIFVAVVFVATSAAAQPVEFEKILLPAEPNVTIHGANGSMFRSALTVAASRPFRYSAAEGVIETFHPDEPPRSVLTVPPHPGNAGGRVIFIEKGASPDVFVQMTVTSQSPGEPLHMARVESLPVARERDFRTGTIVFPRVEFSYANLPVEAIARTPYRQYRHALRLYDVDGRGDVSLRIRIYDVRFATPPLRADVTVRLDRRDGTDATHPYYANIDLDALFSSCSPFSAHTPCAGTPARVVVEPVTPGARYWALLSLTNNFTNEVTLFTP